MTTWNPQANELFLKALEHQDPEAQQAYLDDACAGDAPLRAEVQALVDAGAQAGSFLESPVATVDAPIMERPGTMIGRYKLLEQIGEGGFGIVFMAEQLEPLRRRVALKILKPGMDTRQVIGRFEAERQALALMDHPNIARVLDAGQTDSGRPYFVMELVKGLPITDYCDQAQRTPRQRLELFIAVCQAVQHAHHKGIIHRDLKPTNVLVTMQDGQPLVKVIDFGIAKALGQPLTDKSLFTGFAQLIGTPLYMSPEQVALSNVDVDTRSDVYSLGVLLYELLTGTTPFTQERLKDADYDGLRRIIREEEPPRPSTRISTLGLAATTASAQRQSDPRRLSQLFRGELDWIVMKALEKDRNRRYETASAFAADVQHYLNDEPVLACPPSTWYRVHKFARRNRGMLAATLTGVLVIVLVLVGLVMNNRLVTHEKDQKEAALTLALQEKTRADQNLARARQAVKEYLLRTSGSALLQSGDFQKLRKELLETAIPFYADFVRQQQDDPDLEVERGRAYQELATLRRELGHPRQGLNDLAAAATIFRKLAATFPDEPGYIHELAGTLLDRGSLLSMLGQFDLAEKALREALQMLEPLAATSGTPAEYRATLAKTCQNLGNLCRELGRSAEAESMLQRAITAREQLVKQAPNRRDRREELANSWITLGALHHARHQRGPTEHAFRRALAVLDPKTALGGSGNAPLPVEFQQTRARALNNLGIVSREAGRGREAETAYRDALAIKESLSNRFPSIPQYRQELAGSYNNLGAVLMSLSRPKDAQTAFEKATAIYERLVSDFPDMRLYAVDLAGTYKNLGQLIGDRAQLKESLPWFDKAITLLERARRHEPRFAKTRQSLCTAYWARAMTLCGLHRFQEAVPDWGRAIEMDDGRYQATLRLRRASTLLNLKDHRGATADAQAISAAPQATAGDLYNVACVYAISARLAAADKRVAEAYAGHAVAALRQALARGFNDWGRLHKDADLEIVRARKDFQELMDLPPPGPKQ